MRVLVTGATGFIASSLIPRLEAEGHTIWRHVRYRSGHFDYYDNTRTVVADLRDHKAMREIIFRVKPDVVFHLAAQSAVSWSFLNSHEVMEVNLGGTMAIADALVELQHGHMIHASSSEVYGNAKGFPTLEDEPLGATSPYAVSKIAAEEYLQVLHKTEKLPITIMRPFNTFGRALVDNRHFVVERAITQALTEGVINLHDPAPRRDFLFREDHVSAYLAVVAHLDSLDGETINISTGSCWTIKEMASTVANYVGLKVGRPINAVFTQKPDRPLDIPRLHGSNNKAFRLLSWVPSWTIDKGIQQAIKEWQQVLAK